jgi:hypothetical protein
MTFSRESIRALVADVLYAIGQFCSHRRLP